MSDLKKLQCDVAIIEDVARFLGLEDPSVVEKDIYVTHVIQQLTSIETEYFQLIFAGGTCLAKAHRVVQRSSEDVDFKVVLKPDFERLSTNATRKHLHELRDQVVAALRTAGYPLQDTQIRARNNGKYTYIMLDYPTVNSPAEYQQDPLQETKHSLSALFTKPIYEQNYNDFLRTMVFSGQGPTYNAALTSLQHLSVQVFDRHAI